MAQQILFNGVVYTIPDPGDEDWGAAVTSYLVAIPNGVLQRSGGTFTLTNEVDFGATFGLRAPYYKSRATNVSTTGAVRLGNTQAVSWRNAANSADLPLSVDASNVLNFNGVPVITGAGGVIPPAQGGTGISSYAVGDTLYASGVSTLAKLAIGASDELLTVNAGLPDWRKLVNAMVDAAAAIDWSKMAALTASKLLESSAGGVVTPATSSGYAKLTSGTPAYSATIPRADVAAGSANHVVINDGSGNLSSEAQLDSSRGGVPTGAMGIWGTGTAPTGWLLCDGAAVSRSTYAALFGVIGTTFGAGDGSTTFNVPNMQGVVPRGTGSQTINTRSKSGPSLGATQEDQFQGHYHQIKSVTDGTLYTSSGTAGSGNHNFVRGTDNSGIQMEAQDLKADGTNGTPRSGSETRVSALGVNFIIKT